MGTRALAHLLAAPVQPAQSKASKRANLPARDKRRISYGRLKDFETIGQE
jgi:hypothetical protein